MITTREALTKGMSAEALRDGLFLAEQENSELRRILLWAAQFIPDWRRPELVKMLSEKVAPNEAEDYSTLMHDVNILIKIFERASAVKHLPRDDGEMVRLIRSVRNRINDRPTLANFRAKEES